MAKSREQKEQTVTQLSEELGRIKLAVMTDYRGLTVAELDELREQLRAEGIPYRVVKNTLLKMASKQAPVLKDVDGAVFNGPMAMAFGFDDEVAAARILHGFGKTHEALEITGGLTDNGEFLAPEQVKALALLPTKDQLLAQLCATLNAPMSGFQRVLTGNLSGLINILRAKAAQG